jgi:hypothetical protein
VFEYCDQDLKKYFDSCNGEIDPDAVKVICFKDGRYFVEITKSDETRPKVERC